MKESKNLSLIFSKEDETPAIIIQNQVTSYRQLRDEVEKRKDFLSKSKRKSPQFLLSLVANKSLEFLSFFLASLELGVPVAIFSPDWSDSYIAKISNMLGPFSFWKEGELISMNIGSLSKVRANTRVILFTSGTTGNPKGVELSELNISSNIENIQKELEFERSSMQCLFLSLSYSYGLIGQLLPGLRSGQEIRIFNSLMEFKDFYESQVDMGSPVGMVSGVPAHWKTLAMVTTSSNAITHVITAGAFMGQKQREDLRDHFKESVIYNNYGQTELGPRGIVFKSTHPKFFSNITGLPIGDLEASLDKEGRLQLRGSHVMLGYLGDEGKDNGINEEGWLNTKDQAKIEGDLISVLGRSDQIVKIDGERIHPMEIEREVESYPGILDAAVLTEEHPVYGTILCALIVPEPGTDKGPKDLREYLSRLLSPKKIPKIIKECLQIPKNSNGKKDRKLILDAFKNAKRWN